MVLLCKSNNRSSIKEDIFENRFMHVAELNRMGAQISISGNKAYLEGKDKLFGFFVGQVMKLTQGKANPTSVNTILKEKLKK